MFANCIAEGRRIPDFSRSDDYQVSIVIRSEIIDEHFFLFIRSLQERDGKLDVFTLLNLYEIRTHHIDRLYNEQLSAMLEKGYISRHPYYQYVLGMDYFANSISEIAVRTEEFLSLKQTRSLVEKLVNSGFLSMSGNGRATRYRIVNR